MTESKLGPYAITISSSSSSSSSKTASRNVAFKARKLRDSISIMEGQDSFIMREFEDAEVQFGEDGGDVIVDVGNNADLYAANQENTDLINEAYMDEVQIRFMGQDVSHQQPRLVLTKRRWLL